MLFVRYITIRIVGEKIDQALKNKTYFVTNIIDRAIKESHKNLSIFGRFLSKDSMIQQGLTTDISDQMLEKRSSQLESAGISSMILVNTEGVVKGSFHSQFKIGDKLSPGFLMKKVLKEEEVLSFEKNKDLIIVKTALQINSPEGDLLGMMIISKELNQNYINEIYAMIRTDISIFVEDQLSVTTLAKQVEQISNIPGIKDIYKEVKAKKKANFNLDLLGVPVTSKVSLFEDIEGIPIGMLMVSISRNQTLAAQIEAKNMISLLIFVAILFAVALGIFFAGCITDPLRILTEASSRIAEKACDLTQYIEIRTKDEIGQLGKAFNTLINSLKAMILQIRNTGFQIDELSIEIDASTQQQSSGASQQAAAISELTVSIKELAATAMDISKNAMNVEEAAENTLKGMKTINSKFEDTSNKILSLGSKSHTIGTITGLIDDITVQTNILAINAALEAAHAGETGKGFVVVAQEVKALSESTSKSTKDIRQLIKEIQDDINVIVLDIEDTTKSVAKGLEMLQKTADFIQDISSSTQQQKNASDQLAEATMGIDRTTREFVSLTQRSANYATQLNKLSEDLKTIMGEFKLDRIKSNLL
jgi:methyl-accepting chemotaxis protein